MNSKSNSLEEKVKLPPTETISRCYQPQQSNRKVIRILTVAVYVLCVSLAAIMLSLYYIFIWDPTIRPFVTKSNNCDKIVIPEKIAIRLLNTSEVTAEQFYKHILEQYRILNQLQQQRQQFLQTQHIQLQQLAAANRFQEIFATATIIQSNPNDPIKKPITPTNGTFLLEPPRPINMGIDPAHIPILDTAPAHVQKRRQHRKHYGGHHRARGGTQKNHTKRIMPIAAHYSGNNNNNNNNNNNRHITMNLTPTVPTSAAILGNTFSVQQDLFAQQYMETPLNPPAAIIHEPMLYTSMPIPLILNSMDNKRSTHRNHAHGYGEGRRSAGMGANGNAGDGLGARKRNTGANVSGYDAQTYLNPFLAGELIFEK